MRDGDIFFKRNPNDYFPPLNADQQDSLTTLLNKLIVPKPTDYSASPLLPQSVDTINSMIGAPPPVPTFNMTAPENLVATKPTEKAESPIAKAKSMGLSKKEDEKPVEKQEEPKVEEAQTPEEDEYDAAKKREMDFLSMLGIVSGAEKIGQAFAQSYAPGIDFKRLEELGTKEASDILAKRKAASEKRDEAAKIQEEKEKAEYKDPNSQTSQNTRMLTKAMLDTAGLSSLSQQITNMSAYEIDKKFPYLTNIREAKEARDARALQAAATRAAKDELKAQKVQSANYEKENKLAGAVSKLDQSLKYSQGVYNLEQFKNVINGDSGVVDVALIYDYIKALDPSSAVREGEVDLIKSASPFLKNIANLPKKITKGTILPPEVRKQLLKNIESFNDSKRKQFLSHIKPIAQQIKTYNLDPNNVFIDTPGVTTDDVMGTKPSSTEAIPAKAQEPSSTYSDKQERGIKAFMEANNISREKAISVLKDAGRL